MTEPVCRWCSETLEQHVESRAPGAPVPRTPCLLLRSGFVARVVYPAGPTPKIFGREMRNARPQAAPFWDLTIGPFSCSLFVGGFGRDKGRWFCNIEINGSGHPFVDGACDSVELASAAVEKSLTDIETAIRQARTA